MLDHVLGRPSSKSRRLQVLAVLAFWSTYLVRIRSLSRVLSRRLTAWQTVVITMIYLYAARNFSTLVGLASPDPLANMYDATFFRATWVLTALDAGFWTAMKIQRVWLRDVASLLFSAFYLVAAEKADEKVRKVRGNLTVEHLRVSWNKGKTPYLRTLQNLVGPRLSRWPPRLVRIPRPATSDYHGQPVLAWLYYDGSLDHLRSSGVNNVVLDIPGGGFVAMDPRCNDDRLWAWAVQTGLPVLSLDYKKAPEYPFPFALNECFDVYATLVYTRGRCIGLAAQDPVRIVVAGDSAGGNLAAAMTLMVAEAALSTRAGEGEVKACGALPMPDGLVLAYPSLDVNIGSWMSDEQMALIQDRRTRTTNKSVLRRKTKQYSEVAGTPQETGEDGLAMTQSVRADDGAGDANDDDSDEFVQNERARTPKPAYSHVNIASYKGATTPTNASGGSGGGGDVLGMSPVVPSISRTSSYHPEAAGTRLATSSTISYFNDRVLTPEMMRAMIIMYVGPNNRPDFSQNYYLSPILAPDLLLALFPKTYFLTGERDPLVDDTVIFAGRLRRVRAAFWASGGRRIEYRETDGLVEDFDGREAAEVVLVPGVSHGFLQFASVYPPAWKWFRRSAEWIEDAFRHADEEGAQDSRADVLHHMSQARRGRTIRKEQSVNRGFPSKASPSAKATRADTATYEGGEGQEHVQSSGDESPLEMMRMTKVRGKTVGDKGEKRTSTTATTTTPGTASMSSGARETNSKTSPEKDSVGGSNGRAWKKGPQRTRQWEDRQLTKLSSTEDLLGRRMKGIVGGLSGVSEE